MWKNKKTENTHSKIRLKVRIRFICICATVVKKAQQHSVSCFQFPLNQRSSESGDSSFSLCPLGSTTYCSLMLSVPRRRTNMRGPHHLKRGILDFSNNCLSVKSNNQTSNGQKANIVCCLYNIVIEPTVYCHYESLGFGSSFCILFVCL